MDWMRKNPFIRSLRQQLKRFKITAFQFDEAAEMKPEITENEGAPLKEWQQTGRTVITIKLFGYWRQ